MDEAEKIAPAVTHGQEKPEVWLHRRARRAEGMWASREQQDGPAGG